jgi:hypothetical protein
MFDPEDEGSLNVQSIGNSSPNDAVSYPRSLESLAAKV